MRRDSYPRISVTSSLCLGSMSSELFTGTSFVTYIIYVSNIAKFVKFVNYYLHNSDIIISIY